MTTLLGNDYLAWVPDTSQPSAFHAIKGQGTATKNVSQSKIDTSSKDTQGYGTSAYGLRDLTIDLDIKVNLPDANGWSRLETLCAPGAAPFPFEIRKNGSAGVEQDAVFAALVNGSITSVAFNQNGTVDAKVQLGLAAAPTVDTLA